MATRRGKKTTSLWVLSYQNHHLSPVPAQGPPWRWRKPPRSVCCTNQPSRGFGVSAVPAWPDSPDLFADKGFIFLSQHCNHKTNTAKPLELLPAWARCRGTLVAFVPAPLESPIGTTDPAQNSQWAQPQSQQRPPGLPQAPALGFVHKPRVWNQELVVLPVPRFPALPQTIIFGIRVWRHCLGSGITAMFNL